MRDLLAIFEGRPRGQSILALVVGASGFVGQRILSLLGPARAVGTYHRNPFAGGVPFDATNESFHSLLARLQGRFTHAIMLYGTIDVERCAADPAGTAAVNVDSLARMIDDALAAGIVPVFTSTDYVFDGARGGYRETDVPVPCTEYGRQKLAIERRLAEHADRSLTLRLSRVVGRTVSAHSVLGPLVRDIRAERPIRCAIDQRFSPADADDVAGALIRLLEDDARGLFHLAGPEIFSRMELARLLVDNIRAVAPLVRAELVPCRLHDLPFRERRPLDTSLVIDKLLSRIAWQFRSMQEICAAVAGEQFG